nr:hypothetical protein [Blastocatellia bacterium]
MLARPRSDLFRWLIFAAAFAAIISSGTFAAAQDLPRSIRGYKVHGERIRIDGTTPSNGLTITFTEPELAD